jgi:hypothetical protein
VKYRRACESTDRRIDSALDHAEGIVRAASRELQRCCLRRLASGAARAGGEDAAPVHPLGPSGELKEQVGDFARGRQIGSPPHQLGAAVDQVNLSTMVIGVVYPAAE